MDPNNNPVQSNTPVEQPVNAAPIEPVAPVPPVEPVESMAPVPPVQPVAAAPVYAVPPATKATPNKNKLIGMIIGAVLIVGSIIVAFMMFAGPSKDDYRKASTATSDAISTYNDMGSAYVSPSSTSTEVSNQLSNLKTARTKFETQFSGLKSMRAISNDGNMSTLYKTAVDKKTKFDAALDAELEAYDKIYPVVIEITDKSSSLADINNFASFVKDMRTKLEALSLTNTVNKDYVSSLISDMKKLEVILPKVQAGRDDYTKYDSTAVSDFYSTITNLSKDDRSWQSNMDKLISDGQMKDELNKLESSLYDKTLK